MNSAPSAPSIKDVAAAAGVSVGTVPNVLNHPDRVAEPTRQRVLMLPLGAAQSDA